MTRQAKSALPDAPTPMLASVISDASKDAPPAAWEGWGFQHKIDGVRALYSNRSHQFTSRGRALLNTEGMPFHCLPGHLPLNLQRLGVILDGEFYIHGKPFEEVVSVVKNKAHPLRSLVQYVVFDCILPGHPSAPFWDRHQTAQSLCRSVRHLGIYCLPWEKLTHNARFHCEASCSENYEGIMLRDLGAPYAPGKRSPGLMKFKLFEDAEFRILSALEGEGKNKGTLVFILETKTGETFQATSPGTYEKKKADFFLLEQAKKTERKTGTLKLPWQWAKVRFQGISSYKIPRFPVILALFENHPSLE
jgi:ATP-dependent DNA ligase